jgi:pentatricopeptide repeat-containing protein PET309
VMLERTSTCFESGGRKLLRATKPCLRSRQTLHSISWHHGASDLSLPGSRAAFSKHDSGRGGIDNHAANTTPSIASGSYGGPVLEFLYPEKTLALLKHFSAPLPTALSTSRRRHIYRPSARHYATNRFQPPQGEASLDALGEQQEKDESTVSPSETSYELRRLRNFLRLGEPGGQDQAWQLYTAIPAQSLTGSGQWDLRADLLEYLAIDDDPAVPNRVLQLFEELPEEERRSSSYRAAISAYMALRVVGPALQLLEAVPSERQYDFTNIGIDLVLRRTILDEQWDLSLRVFRLFLSHNPAFGRVPAGIAIRWGNTVPGIWKSAATLYNLEEIFQSFLSHVREFQHDLRSSDEKEEVLLLFVMSFAPHVMDKLLQDSMLSEETVPQYFRRLFGDLEELRLPLSVCYEHAIKRLLKIPNERAVDDLLQLRENLYEKHRRLCLNSSSSAPEKPSLNLLRNLIVHYCDHEKMAKAYSIIQDHRMFYPNEPMRAGLLKYLIHCFANHGDLTQVEKYLDEFKANYQDHIDLELLSALPFACARRADVQGAIAQFNRIRDEFGLVQDTACWNILLLAYVRADDLDGALECFNTIMGVELTPDVYTFGPLLDLCAQRGDVEAFEALFSRAEQMGVELTQDVRARSGYVQVFLRAGDAEGAEAIAQGMLKNWQEGALQGHALTHTWNLLIQQHALDRDIAGARERYKEMVDNNIPLDAWTYGSLMRALIEVKQSNAAYKLLTQTMPRSRLRGHALHYAIVMTGFLREGGGQLDLAIEAYKRMIEQGIPQTVSSQEATIRTLSASQLRDLRTKSSKHPNYRLKEVEEAVEKMVAEAVQSQTVYREPRHQRQVDTHNFRAPPQSFYGLLISLYAQRGGYKMCQKLFKKAERLKPNVDNYTTPMTLVTGTMEAHLKAGEYASVEQCWNLALSSAKKLSKTFSQKTAPEPPATEIENLLDPSIRDRYEESRISANRRNILYKASRLYIRSLVDPSNPTPNALQKAQDTIRDLLVNGYTLDVFTWNELVTALAQRGHLKDAFSICEEYLMPSFPGWRNLYPSYIRKDRQGYQWMELRHYEIKRDSIFPRYKTLIVLASEFRRVKKDERNGIGYDESAGGWVREVLEETAPMTVRAIATMPRTNDKLQMEYFHNELY